MTKDSAGEMRYVSPESLVSSFQALGRSMAVTHGRHEAKVPCEVRDADWNHMDQLHRPAVHKTYQKASRLAMGRSFALSLTRVGFFKWFLLVVDIRLGPGLFYQSFTLFNLFYVHLLVRLVPEGGGSQVKLDWYVVSHRWLKFLHGTLIRRLNRLTEVQTEEDTPMRVRRVELRQKGYRFGSDEPDFISCNVLTDNVIPPKLEGIHRFSLNGIDPEGLNRFSAGPIELLIRKNVHPPGITVWPAVCPHEGGPMELGKVCNGTISCPWHNLKQVGATLTLDRPQEFLGNLRLSLEGEELVVQQRTGF